MRGEENSLLRCLIVGIRLPKDIGRLETLVKQHHPMALPSLLELSADLGAGEICGIKKEKLREGHRTIGATLEDIRHDRWDEALRDVGLLKRTLLE